MLPKKIIYDESYIGGSLAILIKSFFSKKKIIIFEKDIHLGGAWKNNYKNNLKNVDVACHLIVTQNKLKSEKIIKMMKLFNVKLKKIDKESFYSDTKNWKAYGKKGPALVCCTGWSDMLNRVKKKVLKKKNITILKNCRANKVIVKDDLAKVYLNNNLIINCKKLFLPSYCDLDSFFLEDQKVQFPKENIQNIHFVFKLKGFSEILNKEYQGFWDLNQNIFDRLSVSSYKEISKSKKEIVLCCRVSKKFKNKLININKKTILNFLLENKLVSNGKIMKLNKITYNCPYRTVEQVNYTKKFLRKNNFPIEIMNTRYMGHFLWKIAKEKELIF